MSVPSAQPAWLDRPVQRLLQAADVRTLTVTVLVAGPLLYIAKAVLSELFSPIRRYPGPFLARWTNIWRFCAVRKGDYYLEVKKLHDKYGPVVRIGPTILDLDYPELIKTLYGTDGSWKKTDFYHNNSTVIDGQIVYHLFSETDTANHARIKRPIVKYYSLGSVLEHEPLVNKALADFCTHLETRFARDAKTCDLGEWIAFCAWDVNGAASFSKRFGYMDHGHDFDQSIEIADKALDYFSAVGQMPFLDFLLDKNPVKRIGPPNLGNITGIAFGHLMTRLEGKDENFNPANPDFLQRFIDAKKTHPDIVDEGIIMGYLLVNLLAGADTTAITVRAAFYYLLKNPAAYQKLVEEVRAAGFGDVAPYDVARQLPYLEAALREAMRIHPGVCMLMERYVPPAGLTLPGGNYVPGGVSVGINPYVMGRNKQVWGEDADEYRPERWLRGHNPGPADETEGQYKERMRLFNATDLAFGGGYRVCIGRNFALMEVYKMVATLVNRFDIEIVDPNREWEVTGSWFLRQKGLECRLKLRQ